jgi:MraZ protein
VGKSGDLGMFRGISNINLDSKGRMAIPARYREHLEKKAKNQLVLTIDTEQRCLLLYPLPVWETIEEKVSALPSFDPAARRIQRLLIGHATEVEVDSSGRILLPPVLREYAGLDKRVMLVGQGKKFEIWGQTEWHAGREHWLTNDSAENDKGLSAELRSLSL